jgi:opacity protein-like surface antigen
MLRSYFERMEGAGNLGAVALVFDPQRPAAADPGGVPVRDGRGPEPDAPGREPASERRGVAPDENETPGRSNIMRSLIGISILAATLLSSLTLAPAAFAQGWESSKLEVSLLGGIHAFNKNDTPLPDNLLGIPAVAGVAYRITPTLSAEGEFTWFIPVQQSVEVAPGQNQDRTPQNTLAYQLGIRGELQAAKWSPYLATGAGAMTVLSNSSADRIPHLDKSQTMFALNFGGGAKVAVNPHWGLRGDFREFVGFPGKDAAGLTSSGTTDPIWLERVTVGLDYRF